MVILDRHFHLGLSGDKAAAEMPADGVNTNASTTKNTTDNLKNTFDEQARRAAEVIVAAGYVFYLCLLCLHALTLYAGRVPSSLCQRRLQERRTR